jgi:hypothetical protein
VKNFPNFLRDFFSHGDNEQRCSGIDPKFDDPQKIFRIYFRDLFSRGDHETMDRPGSPESIPGVPGQEVLTTGPDPEK